MDGESERGSRAQGSGAVTANLRGDGRGRLLDLLALVQHDAVPVHGGVEAVRGDGVVRRQDHVVVGDLRREVVLFDTGGGGVG